VQGEQAEKQRGDANFYRAIDPSDGQEKYCIPATSLKGVWRTGAEKILRTVEATLACDPFEEQDVASQSCSKRLEGDDYKETRNTAHVFAALCPACRLFGSTAHAGLLQIEDSWIDGRLAPAKRTGIAIDRFTGGVKHGALFTTAPLPPGTRFTTSLTITNVAFWHLGLLALVCREMDGGCIRLGSGTRKGLGHIRFTWTAACFRYPSPPESPSSRQILGRSTDEDPVEEPNLLAAIAPQPQMGWRNALWTTYEVRQAALDELRRACVEEALADRLRQGKAGFAYTPGGK
jgi:CRISPR-associated RAMP protein (TIGR02581 family)